MKLFLLLLISSLFATDTYSQNILEIKIEKKSKKTVSRIEIEGSFPNGDTAMRSTIKERLNGKNFKRAKKGIYIVKVRYVVDKNGGISDVRCEADPGYGMCEEALVALLRSTRPVPALVSPPRNPPM